MIDIIVNSDMIKVSDNIMQIKIPTYEQRELISYLIKKTKGKKINLRIGKWYRKRTTGDLSQNHAINGFVQQIAMATGNEFADVKMAAKERALKRNYPIRTVCGKAVPLHEHEINTLQAGYLIDELKQIADELNIRLIEVTE